MQVTYAQYLICIRRFATLMTYAEVYRATQGWRKRVKKYSWGGGLEGAF